MWVIHIWGKKIDYISLLNLGVETFFEQVRGWNLKTNIAQIETNFIKQQIFSKKSEPSLVMHYDHKQN
jgi:hypothetical protein